MEALQIDQVPLFKALPSSEIRFLVGALQHLEMQAGSLVCQEGDPGDSFFIILSGEVEIVKSLGGKDEQFLGVRGPGGYFGEMSLLIPEGRRTATVRTRETSKFAVLNREDFQDLLQRRPTLAYEMVRELSLRLQKSDNDTIRDLEAKNRQLEAMYRELQDAQAQLIEKERLEHELTLARRIQESLLPKNLSFFNTFDLGARMEPARSIGGDLYDFIQLDANRVGIAIGDVSGKGIPAAMFMSLFCSLLRAQAVVYQSPADVLQRVNQHLLVLDQARMFVTALYGVLDCRDHTFNYARAGHEVPILFDPNGQVVSLGRGMGQLLGFFEDLQLDQQTITLEGGSSLVLYTDGVLDAVDRHGERFCLDRFITAVASQVGTPAQELCDYLVRELLEFQSENGQFDDITLVTISHVREPG